MELEKVKVKNGLDGEYKHHLYVDLGEIEANSNAFLVKDFYTYLPNPIKGMLLRDVVNIGIYYDLEHFEKVNYVIESYNKNYFFGDNPFSIEISPANSKGKGVIHIKLEIIWHGLWNLYLIYKLV